MNDKKKRPNNLPIWIAITALSFNQFLGSQIDYQFVQKLQYQSQEIQSLFEMQGENNYIHKKVEEFLQAYLKFLQSVQEEQL